MSASEIARERTRKRWSRYGACTNCRALPGMPCRDRDYNPVRLLNRPHPGRLVTDIEMPEEQP